MENIKKICVFGDSLVYGMGDHERDGGWVSRLQEKLGSDFELVNYGIPGDHTLDLLKRLKDECKESHPDSVIILIGANDSQYETDKENTLINPASYKENLGLICEIIKTYTAKIIFIGLPNMDDSITTTWDYKYHFCNENLIKYDWIIKEFCQENNYQYIPLFGLLSDDDLNDGAHPNGRGYEKIALKIKKEINL